MTLHFHLVDKMDGRTTAYDDSQPRRVPAGWQIADGSADDVRVCGAHAWQTQYLVLANGSLCGTAAGRSPGAPRRCC